MEQLKSRYGLEDRMARDLVRNAQRSPQIIQKNCKKRVAGTRLAVYRTTMQHILNNKDIHGSVARKKPFL